MTNVADTTAVALKRAIAAYEAADDGSQLEAIIEKRSRSIWILELAKKLVDETEIERQRAIGVLEIRPHLEQVA